jgi:hypothetical protein
VKKTRDFGWFSRKIGAISAHLRPFPGFTTVRLCFDPFQKSAENRAFSSHTAGNVSRGT